MHCRNCDYPLWNLPGRECPECGTTFKPSSYDFKPGAVKFCCRHCDQEYYGTSIRGHLVPDSFDCVGCGKHVNMDEMKLLPADGWEEVATSALDAPWLRKNSNIVRRWFSTVGWSYVKPIDLMRGTPANAGISSAWWFMVLTQVLSGMLGIGIPILVIGGLIALGTRGGPGGVGAGTLGVSGLSSFASIIGVIIFALIWGVLAHGTLVITGGSTYSIGRTMCAIFYSSGTMAIQAVPCIGPYCFSYIVSIWWLVSAILMVAEGQKVSGARASLAVLWFPLGLVCLLIAGYLFFIVTAIGGARMGAMGAMVPPATPTISANNVIANELYAEAERSGAWPDSLFDIVESPGFSRSDRFEFFDMVTNGNSIGVELLPGMDGTDIAMLDTVPFQRRIEQLREQEIPYESPSSIVDHVRFGAIVYCTPGLAVDASNNMLAEDLWVLVVIKRYGVRDSIWCHICDVGGNWQAEPVPSPEFKSLLSEQNVLRSRLGLEPITSAIEEAEEYLMIKLPASF